MQSFQMTLEVHKKADSKGTTSPLSLDESMSSRGVTLGFSNSGSGGSFSHDLRKTTHTPKH